MSKVSIMIPLYNSGDLICKALDSCLAQTYKDIEIIVINDGSTDDSPKFVRPYIKEHNNIRMYTTENRGLPAARNEAVRYAEGEYFYFLDNDDWIEPNMVEECVEAMQEGLDYVFFDANIIEANENGNWNKTGTLSYRLNPEKIYSGSVLVDESYKINCLHQVWRGFYRRSFIEDNNLKFKNELCIEDLPFWFEVVMCAKRTRYINKCYHNYRFVNSSITRTPISWKKVDTALRITDHILTLLDLKNNAKEYCLMGALKIGYLLKEFQEKADAVFCESIADKEKEILQIKAEILRKANYLYKEDDYDLLVSKYCIYQETIFFMGVYEEKWIKELYELKSKVKSILVNKMKAWGLTGGERVGIYGTGRNADILLKFYEAEFGNISPDVVFIDSYKESGKYKHLNRDIINVKDIREYGVEKVVICSYLYEEQIVDTLQELYGDDIIVIPNCDDMKVSFEDTIFPDKLAIYERLCNGKEKNRIILLFTPDYANVGDHLIAKGEQVFIEKYLDNFELVELTNTEYSVSKPLLHKLVNENDIIAITGGGFLGTLWPKNNKAFFECAEGFKDNKVIVFPQSLFISDDEIGEWYTQKIKELFNVNKNLVICLREKISYTRAIQLLGQNDRICLFPDMALCLSSVVHSYNVERKKIGVFLRTDLESVLENSFKSRLESKIQKSGTELIYSSMQYGSNVLSDFRDVVIEEKLCEISSCKLIITDMLHCMLACVLTQTPCFAMNNLSKKVQGVYEWIKELDYIKFFENPESILFQEELIGKNDITQKVDLEEEFNGLRQLLQRGK